MLFKRSEMLRYQELKKLLYARFRHYRRNFMKKVISTLILLSMVLTMCVAANAVTATIKVMVNSKVVDFKGYNPYKSASGIMVPLSEAAKAAGATVDYVKTTNEAKITLGKTVLIFQAGRKSVLINGKSFSMNESAAGVKGKIYVPVRLLFEKMGGTVAFDSKTNTVIVTIKTVTPTPDTKSTPPQTPTGDNVNVAMPASLDFKPYIAELKPIDPDILKELQAYKDDKDGDLMHKINGIGINMYMTNEEVIKKVGVDVVKNRCIVAKSMLEVENNVDYRTINNDFIQKYRYYFTPLSESGEITTDVNLIKHRYDDIKKYKIVEKAEFFTDTSLNYESKNGENRVRGRLKFMFESIDPQYFKDHSLPTYELNKWYVSDIEMRIEIFLSKCWDLWLHSYYTYKDRVYLTDVKLSYDK